MKIRGLAAVAAFLCQLAWAQDSSFDYRLGSVRVIEGDDRIVLHAIEPITIEVFNGGHTWPQLSLGEDGRIYAGAKVIDAINGRLMSSDERGDTVLALPYDTRVSVTPTGYRIVQGRASCSINIRRLGINSGRTPEHVLKNGNLVMVPYPHGVVALATQFGTDGKVGRYMVTRLRLDRCRTAQSSLDNPDLLVELNASRNGGWWITGSIEQTLLRSTDGIRWRKLALPEELGALISSYVVDNNEIWLAAYLSGHTGEQLGLVYSADGGKHWRTLGKGDPLLARLPKGWLEGQKRSQQ